MLRSRFKLVKELDAFPKVQEPYVKTSPVGGTFSVVTFILVIWLTYSEISYYLDSRFIFKFLPDTDFDAKLKINVDLTVAMPCNTIGADILDSTSQNVLQFGTLEQEDTWFEMSPEQRRYFDEVRSVNTYLREEYHAIQSLLWKSSQSSLFGEMPERTRLPNRPTDACRVTGSLTLNKVSGNFHITAGRSLSLPRGHVHISTFLADRDYNFTHRIRRFSFGEPSPGIVHPLEGDEKVTDKNMVLFQYFVEIVPTEVDTHLSTLSTFQYAVKDSSRPLDHAAGSHGVPGIFFKYDVSALKVRVTQDSDSLAQLLVRLCASVGGLYVTAGMANSVVQALADFVRCRRGPRSFDQRKTGPTASLTTDSAVSHLALHTPD